MPKQLAVSWNRGDCSASLPSCVPDSSVVDHSNLRTVNAGWLMHNYQGTVDGHAGANVDLSKAFELNPTWLSLSADGTVQSWRGSAVDARS